MIVHQNVAYDVCKRLIERENSFKVLCRICGNHFSHTDSCKRHMKTIHAKDLQKVSCDVCSRLIERAHIARHKKIHESFKVPCYICGKHFSRLDSCKRHVKSVHARDLLRINNLEAKNSVNQTGYSQSTENVSHSPAGNDCFRVLHESDYRRKITPKYFL